jgi:arylsulfatase A-like enzyme
MKILLLLSLLVLAGPVVAAAPPNVLFIMTDQQMADAMSFRQGDRYLRTPALDRLAARGTYFSRAYAPNPLCMPARNSIFTGRFPHETKISDNADMRSGRTLDPTEFPTLGTTFERAGYRTAYFGKWHLSYDVKKPETHGFQELDPQQKDTVSADRAVAFLRTPQPKPFLLVVSFLNPHNIAEYTRGQPLSNGPIGEPPALAAQPPPPTNLGHPVGEPDTMTLIRQGYHANRRLFPVGNFSPSIWQAMRWGYYRLVEKVDAEIGRVLTALHESGLEENTLIVFVSDHGECVGAHGLAQKTVFYEESVRVPLIISAPGQSTARTDDRLVNVGISLSPHDARLRGRATPGQAARHQPAAAGRGTTGAGLDRRGDLEQPHVAGWICRRLRTCDRRTHGAHGPVQVLRLCARRAAGITGRSDQRPRRNGRPGARSGLPDRPPRTPGTPPALWSHPW